MAKAFFGAFFRFKRAPRVDFLGPFARLREDDRVVAVNLNKALGIEGVVPFTVN